jgi:hypothetical protein
MKKNEASEKGKGKQKQGSIPKTLSLRYIGTPMSSVLICFPQYLFFIFIVQSRLLQDSRCDTFQLLLSTPFFDSYYLISVKPKLIDCPSWLKPILFHDIYEICRGIRHGSSYIKSLFMNH